MSSKSIFMFRWRPKNYYSFASLVPVLQKNFPTLPTIFIKKSSDKTAAQQIQSMINEYTTIFFFDSFMSIDVPDVLNEMQSIYKQLSKDQREKLITVAGGPHPTAAPVHTVLDLGYNIVARGEGEVTIEKIVKTILEGKAWIEIPGITFNDNGFIQKTPSAPRISLDDYQPYSDNPPIHPPIELMRGCSFGCKFCQTPRILREIRYRSLDSIDKIVQHYCNIFKTRSSIDIRFIAPNSLEYGSLDHHTPNIEVLWKLVKTVKKYPVKMFLGSFPSEVRPEFVIPETVEILKESNSKIVAVGAQSGSEKMLEKMHRGHTIQDILNCVDYLLDEDLVPQLDFILGLPDETLEEMWMTIHLIEQLAKKGCRIRLHGFMPLKGTPWGNSQGAAVPNDILATVNKLMKHYKTIDGALSKQLDLADALLSYRDPITPVNFLI